MIQVMRYAYHGAKLFKIYHVIKRMSSFYDSLDPNMTCILGDYSTFTFKIFCFVLRRATFP